MTASNAHQTVPTLAFVALFALTLFAVSACHRSPPPQAAPAADKRITPVQTVAPAKAEPFPQELPALYTGSLPCADCEGIRYELDLRRDQVFFARMTYLGKPAPNTFECEVDCRKSLVRRKPNTPGLSRHGPSGPKADSEQ